MDLWTYRPAFFSQSSDYTFLFRPVFRLPRFHWACLLQTCTALALPGVVSASLVQIGHELARSKTCKKATCLQPCDDRFEMSTKLVK